MNRSNLKSDRRNAFIAAAEYLFNEKGFENTSVDDIVDKVGVAKGLFYYYFDSKEELLAQIVQRLIEEVRLAVKTAMEEKGLSAMERLKRMSEANEAIKKKSVKLIAYFHENRNKALHYCMEDQAMEFMVPAMELIIKQGVEEGVFDVPYPRDTAIALLYSLKSISHDHLYDGANEKVNLERIKRHVAERLLGCVSMDQAKLRASDGPS